MMMYRGDVKRVRRVRFRSTRAESYKPRGRHCYLPYTTLGTI